MEMKQILELVGEKFGTKSNCTIFTHGEILDANNFKSSFFKWENKIKRLIKNELCRYLRILDQKVRTTIDI